MNNNYLLKSRAVIALLLCFSWHIDAQEPAAYSALDLINGSGINISTSAVLYNNLTIQYNGKDYLKSIGLPSFVSNATYHQRVTTSTAINVGVGLSIVPQNIFFNFLCTLPDPYEEERHYKIFDRYYGLVMGEIPISFQKIYPIRSNAPRPMFASFELGFKYNFVVDYALYITSYIDVIGDSGVLIFQQWHEPVRTSLESYFFKCGIIRISRGDKIMQYNLVFNYSPKNIIGGSYVFENLPFESYGSVSQGINYIGFEFSYGLIRKKQKSI